MTKNYFDRYTSLVRLTPKGFNYASLMDGAKDRTSLSIGKLSEHASYTCLWLEITDYENIKVTSQNEISIEALLLNRIYKKNGLYFYTNLYTFGNKEAPLPFDMYFFLNISNGDLFKPLKSFGFSETTIRANYNELMDIATLIVSVGRVYKMERKKLPQTYKDFLETYIDCFIEATKLLNEHYTNLKAIETKNEEEETRKKFALLSMVDEMQYFKETIKSLIARLSDLEQGKEDEKAKETLYPTFLEGFLNRGSKETYTISKANSFDMISQGKIKGYRIAYQTKITQIAPTIKKYSNNKALLKADESKLNRLNDLSKEINELEQEALSLPIGAKERELITLKHNAKSNMLVNYANQNQVIIYKGFYYKNTNKNVRVCGAVGDDKTLCRIELSNTDNITLSLSVYLCDLINTFYKGGNNKSQNDIVYKSVLLYTLSKIANAHSRDIHSQSVPILCFTGNEIYKAVTGKTYEVERRKANTKGEKAIKNLETSKKRAKEQFKNALSFLYHANLILGEHGEMAIIQGILDIDTEKGYGKEFKSIDGDTINNGVAIIPSDNLWNANIYGNKGYGTYFYIPNLDKTESIEEFLLALCLCLAESNGGEKKGTYKFPKLCEYLCIEPPSIENTNNDKKAFYEDIREKKKRIIPYLLHLKQINAIDFKESDLELITKTQDCKFVYAMPISVVYDDKAKKDLKKISK